MSDRNDDNNQNDDDDHHLAGALGGAMMVGFFALAHYGMTVMSQFYEAGQEKEKNALATDEASYEQMRVDRDGRAVHFTDWRMEPAKDMPAHDDPEKLYDITITGIVDAPRGAPMLWSAMDAAAIIVRDALGDQHQVMGKVTVDQGSSHLNYTTDIVIGARIEGTHAEVSSYVESVMTKLKEQYSEKIVESPSPEMEPQGIELVNTGRGNSTIR